MRSHIQLKLLTVICFVFLSNLLFAQNQQNNNIPQSHRDSLNQILQQLGRIPNPDHILAFTITVSKKNVTCGGLCNGQAYVSISGGVGPFTIKYIDGLNNTIATHIVTLPTTNDTLFNLCADTYTIEVTDPSDPSNPISDFVQITAPPVILINFTNLPLSTNCANNCDAAVTANISFAVGAQTFLWSPGGQPVKNATTLCAGVNTLTVTDANGCTQTKSLTVTSPLPLSAGLSVTQPLCLSTIGSADVTPTGGTSPYTVKWSIPAGSGFGAVTSQPSLATGSYWVVVKDARGCRDSVPFTITPPPNPTATITAHTNVTCFGLCNGSANATASGGTTPYASTIWTGPGSNINTLNTGLFLCAGTWTLTVTDANGCFDTAMVVITQPPLFTVNAGTDTSKCFNDTIGLFATPNPAAAGIGYQWVPVTGMIPSAGNTQSVLITSNTSTPYMVTATNAAGCTNKDTVNVIVNALPVITSTPSAPSVCIGSCVTITASLNTPGAATFHWSPNGAGSPAFMTPASGDSSVVTVCPPNDFTYTITGRDVNGCVNDTTVTAVVKALPTITTTGSTTICPGGSATICASGSPAGTYGFSWAGPNIVSGGNTACVTVNPSSPGSTTCWVVTGTDAFGCSDTETVCVTVSTLPNVFAGLDKTICFGASTTITGISNQVPTSFQWTPNGAGAPAFMSLPSNGSAATVTIAPTATQIYTVTGTNAFGCVKTDDVTVNVLAQLPVNAGNDTTICQSSIINLTASGAANYSWVQLGGGPNSIIGGAATAVLTINPTVTTSYVVTGSSGSCSENDTVKVTVNTLPIVSAGNDVAICIGTSAALTGTGALTYTWSPNGAGTPAFMNPASGIGSVVTVSPTASQTYIVTGTDANGCKKTDNVIVIVNTLPIVNAGADKSICLGSSAILNASGAVNYSWTPSTGLNLSNISNPTTSAIITTLYTVTGTDNNGCTNSDQVNVSVNSVTASASVDTTIYCSGGSSVQLFSNGGGVGGTYLWSPANPTSNISNPNFQNPTAAPTASTTYTVTVTDINNCSATANVTVTFDQVTLAIADTTSPTACGNNDGAIDLTVLTGIANYTYSWSGGAGTSQDPSGLAAGAYTVIVTDSKGCTGTVVAILDDPSSMTLSAVVTPPSTCGGSNGCIDLTVSNLVGSPVFNWNSGAFTTEDICGLGTGTYNVIVTDGSNCTKAASVIVNNPTPLAANAGNDTAICAGGLVTLNANSGFTSYSWTPGTGLNPDSISQTVTIIPAISTTYILSTVDPNNCPSTDFVTVTVNPIPVADAGSDASICPGSSFHFNASGGGTYLWTANPSFTGSLTIANPIATPTATTTYTVTVRSVNGCVNSDNITLTLSPLVLSETHTDVTVCGLCDGTVDLTVNGGNFPYNYAWSNSATIEDLSSLCLGGYNVIVNDALGCSDTLSVSIQSPTTLSVTGVVTNIVTCGINNGAIDITCVGGSGALTINWTDFSGNPIVTGINAGGDISGLSAGIYTVVVTDASGCGQAQTFTITQPPAPVISAGSDVTICANGSANLNVTTTGAGNTFAWGCGFVSTPSVQNPTVTPAATTTYCVTVTSPQSCSSTDSVKVNVTGMVLIPVITNVSTCGAANGSILINISNGTFPFNYVFGPSPVQSSTSPAYNNLAIGSYSVIVTDGLGCIDSLNNILVNDPSNVAVAGVKTNNLTCGASNGSINITVTGNNGPATFAWVGPGIIPANATNEDQFNLTAGTYSVTVTDSLSCGTSASFTISDPTPIKPNAGPDMTLCNGTNVQLSADITNIQTFLWDHATILDNAAIFNPVATPTTTTIIILTTTDVNNCQSKDTLTLNVLPSPNISAGPDLNLCTGGSNQLIATGGVSYTWSPSLGLDLTNIPNPTATPGTTTIYTVTGFSINGCTSRDSATVFNSGLSLSSVTTQPTVCGLNNGSIDLSVGLGISPFTYQWSTNTANATTQDVSLLTAGIYTVLVVDSIGCSDSLTSTISDPGNLTGTITTTSPSTCGGINGTATVTPLLGTSPYTQSWTPGNITTLSINGPAGTYFVTVTDSIGCSIVLSGAIVNPTANPVSAGPDIITCKGDTLTLNVTAGTAYSWSPASFLNFSNLQSPQSVPLSDVTYIVSVTDNINCVAFDTLVIDVQDMILSENHTNITTCGGTNGAINLTVTGGSGSYTYQWTKNQVLLTYTTQDISGNIATPVGFGNYTVYVSDLISGCFDSLTVSLSEPTPFTFSETHTNPTTCNGSNGSISITLVGANNPSFSWLPSTAVGQNPTGLGQGVYNGIITDASLCSAALSVSLTQPTPTSYTAGNDVTICYGTSTTLNAIPNTGSFVWTASNGTIAGANTASPVVTPSTTATYNLTVTDVNNCVVTDQVQVNVIRIFSNGAITNASTCISPDGMVVVNPSGATAPYTYAWNPASAGTNDTVANAPTGNYIVTITESSAFACQEVDTFVINSAVPLQVFAGNDTTLCNNVNSLSVIAVANPSQGAVYTWTQLPSAVIIDNDSALNAALIPGSQTFQVTAVNGSCTASDQIVINVSGIPIKPNAGPDVSLCNGTTVQLNAGTANIQTFLWDHGTTLTDSSINNPVAQPTATTIYILTTTDINNCQSSDTLTLNVFSSPNVDAGPSLNLCSGGSNQLTATGGLTYLWNTSTGLSPTNSATPTVNPIVTTTYYVTGFNAIGCSATDSVTVFKSVITLTAVATSPTICAASNGSIDLTASGGVTPYSYLWGPNTGNATTEDILGTLPAGIYTVNVTDSLGCSNSLTTTISDPTNLTAPISTTQTTTCGGINGTATAVISLGTPLYTHVWNNPAADTSLTITVPSGVYCITVTDAINCTIVSCDTVKDPTANPVSAGPDIITCEGGVLNLSVTAGTAYTWTPNVFLNFNSLQTPQSTPLSDVTYVVSVTDNKNCVATDTLVIDVQNLILSALPTNVTTCGGINGTVNLTVTGGSGSYAYQWIKNQTINVDTTQDLSGNATTPIGFGNYTVYVSDLISGCFDSLTVSISDPTPYTVTEVHTNPTTCNGTEGTITLTITNASNPVFSWSGPNSFASVFQDLTGLGQGTYNLIMSDASLCSAALSIALTQPTPTSYTAGNDVTICYGTSTTLNALPNTANSFAWTPASTLVGATTASPVATPPGTLTYAVTVTDINNCVVSDSVKVSVIRIFANGIVTNATSCINADGLVTLNPSGGITPYTYLWSDSSTAFTLTNVVTGSYSVTITESSSFACQEVDTFTVNSLIPLQVFAGNDTTLCNGVTSLNIIASSNPSQGTVYTWTLSAVVVDNDSLLVANPTSGTVIYQVDAVNGACSATDQISITVGSPVNANAGQDVSIYIGESVTIGGNPSGPVGSIFEWTPSGTLNSSTIANPSASNEETTTYILTVTTSLGCIGVDSVIVTVTPEVKFPNGLSPNGDGKNDVWIIDLISKYPQAIVQVFNRWGQNVFTSAPGYTTPWDGTYNGKDLPVGTYYYIIDLKDEKYKPYTGPITIFR